MKKPIVGAQLYTVREHTKTMPEIVETFRKVAGAGYRAVQLSAVGTVDSKDLAAAMKDAGLVAAATHVAWEKCLTDLENLIAQHKIWGCRHMAIGGLPARYFTKEGLAQFVEEVTRVGERLSAESMDFSYHNHNHELARHDGEVWLRMLYERADPRFLKAELDTYWVQAGGGDPAEWVHACAGREPLLHLKDMLITPERELRFAEVGEGNLNWPAILKAAEDGGVEYLLVEQDSCYGRDPFESLAISYRNLSRWGYR